MNNIENEDPREKDWQMKQNLCDALRNPVYIELEKKLIKAQFNNYTLRLKRLFENKGTPEQWKKMKVIWKSIINFYKEKNII